MKNTLYTKFGVHIKVQNIRSSLKYYTALQFNPVFAYGDKKFLKHFNTIPTAPEKYNGIVFDIGNSTLEIADGHLAVKPEVFKKTITNSKISAMIQVRSLSNIEKLCKKNKIEITVPRRKFPWGTTELVLKDPDGLVLVFIENLHN